MDETKLMKSVTEATDTKEYNTDTSDRIIEAPAPKYDSEPREIFRVMSEATNTKTKDSEQQITMKKK